MHACITTCTRPQDSTQLLTMLYSCFYFYASRHMYLLFIHKQKQYQMLLQVQERQLIGLVSLICSLSCYRQLYTNWHYFLCMIL